MDSENQRFDRQRRNLLLLSVLLCLIYWAEITITEINIIGNKADIKEPGNFIALLWVLHGWWLYRYYVYFMAIGLNELNNLAIDRATILISRNLQNLTLWHLRDRPDVQKMDDATIDYDSRKISGGPIKGRFIIEFKNLSIFDNNGHGVGLGSHIVKIPPQKYGPYVKRGYIYAIFNRPYVTEYLSPFIIALLPIFFWFWRACQS